MAGSEAVEREFREFVATRSAALHRTAYLLAGDWANAEDLVQTVLAKVYLNWRRIADREAVDAYARRVLATTATSWWRRRWHGERPTERLPDVVAADHSSALVERDALWRRVRALPVRQRAVLVLRYYEDCSEAETADVLGVSVGTVKSHTARALQTLRRRLTTDGVPSFAGPRRGEEPT